MATKYMYSRLRLGKKKKKRLHLGKRLLLITKNKYPKLMILVLFYVWEDARIKGR